MVHGSPSSDTTAPMDGLERGIALLYAGDLEGAERALRCAVDAGGAPDAHAALADVLVEMGRPSDAIPCYRAALAADPGRWTWRVGLADASWRAGDAAGALDLYRGLAAERPDAAGVRRGLARALAGTGRTAEAVAEYREAAILDPRDIDGVVELGALLIATGDALAAAELLEPASRRLGDHPELLVQCGRAWMELRERDKALAVLRRARAVDGEDACGAERLIAALEAGDTDDLTPTYVRALFDRYADRFDADLLGKLGYQGPRLIAEAIEAVDGRVPTELRVLDLGCGTGLAGPLLRPMARRLVGVDLSPRMVEKARARGVYDEARVDDIVAAMEAEAEAWDLLAAADVLVYLGDLEPVFRAAARALVQGGRFVATTERLEEGNFELRPTRRYAHSANYLRRTAAAAGLTVRLLEERSSRSERREPVPGLVFVLERADRMVR